MATPTPPPEDGFTYMEKHFGRKRPVNTDPSSINETCPSSCSAKTDTSPFRLRDEPRLTSPDGTLTMGVAKYVPDTSTKNALSVKNEASLLEKYTNIVVNPRKKGEALASLFALKFGVPLHDVLVITKDLSPQDMEDVLTRMS